MKQTHSLSLLLPLLALPSAADLFPNGNFDNGSSSWGEVQGGPGPYTFDYPATGGNTGGFGVIDASQASDDVSFAIWVGNGDDFITLESMGLTAGSTYLFSQDMKILSGDNLGRFKIDFFNGVQGAGTTGKLASELIGDGSTWKTYGYEILIPAGVDRIKVVPESGISSSVGFDNIGYDPTPILPPVEPPVTDPGSEPQFVKGTLVTWSPTNAAKIHQPQASADGTTWTDLGPAFPGTETTSILDPDSAPFHRVVEKDPASDSAIINGDFEIADFDNPTCPESWKCLSTSGQFPTLITSDAFSGTSSMRLAVQNDAGGSPSQGEIQQNLADAGGFVTGGETYTFSFRAKQISSGVSYVQNYRLQWLNGANTPINGADVGFNSFSGGTGSWAKVSTGNIVAPANATGVFIQIFGATGAVAGTDAKGEVLIDSINLSVGGQSEPVIFATTKAPGVGVFMLTKTGKQYKAQVSDDLENYTDLSGTFPGNGTGAGAGTPFDQTKRFYRFLPIEVEVN